MIKLRAYLVPHVPFMIPEMGGEELQKYIPEIMEVFEKIRSDILNNPPDAILICSPHFEGSNTFRIGRAKEYHGSFANFSRPDIVDIRKGALEISTKIQSKAEDIGFLAPDEAVQVSNIDYGTIVPLKFIDPNAKIPIIPISISLGTKKEHFIWGQRLFDYVSEFSDNIVFIASTELTQDFQQDPRAYPNNSNQDVKYLQMLQNQEIEEIEKFDHRYFERVENQLLPTCILSGFGYKLDSEVMLYTGFVGCGCAFLKFF